MEEGRKKRGRKENNVGYGYHFVVACRASKGNGINGSNAAALANELRWQYKCGIVLWSYHYSKQYVYNN